MVRAIKAFILLAVVCFSATGCSTLIPDKPFPTNSDYSMATLSCAQAHHPSTTFFGECVSSQIGPKIEDVKSREGLKSAVLGVEIWLWSSLLLAIINGEIANAWADGVATGAYYY